MIDSFWQRCQDNYLPRWFYYPAADAGSDALKSGNRGRGNVFLPTRSQISAGNVGLVLASWRLPLGVKRWPAAWCR
jgi:hypothetical protein